VIRTLIEKIRTWRAFRRERARAFRRAEMRARLMLAGGLIQTPNQRKGI